MTAADAEAQAAEVSTTIYVSDLGYILNSTATEWK